MPALKLDSPSALQGQLGLFTGQPDIDLAPEAIIFQLIASEEMLALQAANLARRMQIETEYKLVIPDHYFASALDEANWLRLAHHVLWWTYIGCSGGWGDYEGIVILTLDELVHRLDEQ